jgi:hypothetical protein
VCAPAPTWILQTTAGDTCTTTCSAGGYTCTDGDWGADSEATLNAALAAYHHRFGRGAPAGSGSSPSPPWYPTCIRSAMACRRTRMPRGLGRRSGGTRAYLCSRETRGAQL